MSAPLKWEKLGLVFDPGTHQLPLGCREFAQSPQAVVFDDFVRIYFSSRSIDAQGKFLSQVCFVDMDKRLQKTLRVSDRAVLPLGEKGTFDEHGIFPFSPVKRGERVYAYTCGWSRRVSVPVATAIGLAVSTDGGLTFERQGNGPVLASSLHEPFLVGDGFVAADGDQWSMWYIFGVRWIPAAEADGAPSRVYKIGQAFSRDGVHWERESGKQVIADAIGEDECQALPTVVKLGGRWHMSFCFRHATDFRKNKDRGYRLGYAYSDDGRTWTRADQALGLAPSAEGWDSEMRCYPNLFRCDDRVYLLYNGNAFGRGGFGAAVLKA